jgi:hypothetical protein
MVQLHLLTPEPGTRLATEFGDALEYDGHVTDFNFPTLEPDDADAMRLDPEVFVNHHYYRTRLPRSRHILVTSLFPSLRKLGFPVMRHLVSHHDGRLSLFYARVEEWARARGEAGPFDSDFLCRFMDDAWGRSHQLTSLVRYIVTADRLRPSGTADRLRPSGTAPASAEPNGGSYVLSPAAAALPDLHDCPSLLAALGAREPVPDEIESARANYLLLLDDPAERRIRNFEIDDALLELIEGFASPHTLAEGAPDPEARSQVEELVRLGALTEVGPTFGGE